MAIPIEGVSVVIRVSTVVERLPGGWGAFIDAIPGKDFCCDDELARVTFLTSADANAYLGLLAKGGLVAEDAVCIDEEGPATPCKWVEFGYVEFRGDRRKSFPAAREVGSSTMIVATPSSWWRPRLLSDESDAARLQKARHTTGGIHKAKPFLNYPPADPWVKVVDMLQQNWAVIDHDREGTIVRFIDDLGEIFDEIRFASAAEADKALRRNGFGRFADDAEFLYPPAPPFLRPSRLRFPVYSSGEYWQG